MRYFIDTEFHFDAKARRVEPISIGIVAEDGREFYAVNANWSDGIAGDATFVQQNVVPVLEAPDLALYVHGELATIARDIRRFTGDDTPEFWGDYAAFDYVVLSIIMGGFDAWPDGWPMVINDLQATPEGRAASAATPSALPHNALADARAVRDAYLRAFRSHIPA